MGQWGTGPHTGIFHHMQRDQILIVADVAAKYPET